MCYLADHLLPCLGIRTGCNWKIVAASQKIKKFQKTIYNFSGFSSFIQEKLFMTHSYLARMFLPNSSCFYSFCKALSELHPTNKHNAFLTTVCWNSFWSSNMFFGAAWRTVYFGGNRFTVQGKTFTTDVFSICSKSKGCKHICFFMSEIEFSLKS